MLQSWLLCFLNILVFSIALILAQSQSQSQLSCDSNKGTCIDTTRASCDTGILKPGYCDGPSTVICCEPQSCDANKGHCVDTRLQTCDNGILKSGYCPGDSSILCCEPASSELPERCYGSGPPLPDRTYEFTLQNQGFSGHPGALVYVPSNFDKASPTLEIVVYIHGYNNCLRNMVRKQSENCNCSVGQDLREAYNLLDQFESAALASKATNRLFVGAEVAYDLASDNPGRWAEQGVLKAYLNELLTLHMKPVLGNAYSVDSISRVRIFSHSGGYYTIGNMATVGGVNEKVQELVLLDSLYADFSQFDGYVTSHLQQFGTKDNQYRFASLFTLDGGTYNNNINMENKAKVWVSEGQCENILFVDNEQPNSELTANTIGDYSLIFKYTSLEHNDVVRTYFYNFLVGAV